MAGVFIEVDRGHLADDDLAAIEAGITAAGHDPGWTRPRTVPTPSGWELTLIWISDRGGLEGYDELLASVTSRLVAHRRIVRKEPPSRIRLLDPLGEELASVVARPLRSSASDPFLDP